MQDSDKFSITIWTPKGIIDWEGASIYDLLRVRNDIDKKFIYYDLPGIKFEWFKDLAITGGNPLNHFSNLEWDAQSIIWASNVNTKELLHTYIDGKCKGIFSGILA